MNLLAQARQAVIDEQAAWDTDPLRYQPALRSFLAAHDLAWLPPWAQSVAVVAEPGLGRPPGYPWQHGLRVAAHALRLMDALAETEEPVPDRIPVVIAAIGHDLTHRGEGDQHQRSAAELVERELRERLPAATLATVVRWIADSDRLGSDLELGQQVLWDANALDLQGAMFVVRALTWAGANGLPPEVLLAVFGDLNPFHAAWIDRAHFAVTRDWLREHAAAERAFIDRLAAELNHPTAG